MLVQAFWLCVICAACMSSVSLISSYLYRREPGLPSELMSFASFLPTSVFCAVLLLRVPLTASPALVGAIFLKNIFYCLSFHWRYESLRKFGPFVGALMLGTQPIFVFVFGLLLLGEHLSLRQEIAVLFATTGLILLSQGGSKTNVGSAKIRWGDFLKYYGLPSLLSSLVVIIDRYFLKGEISGGEFFILDRVLLLPTFLLSVWLIQGRQLLSSEGRQNYRVLLIRHWKGLTLIAVFFTLAGYLYNLALELERAALVTLFRNAAYPMAALIGSKLFKQAISIQAWLSLGFIFAAIFCAAF